MTLTVTHIVPVENTSTIPLPLASSKVAAGFPSPADDHMVERLDLNHYLIRHPAATFMVRVSGHSMIDAGIHEGDLLIVDRAESPRDKSIIIAVVNGELTVKRVRLQGKTLTLVPENPDYPALTVTEEMHFSMWGVVTYVIHTIR